jgi:hypothetical protein
VRRLQASSAASLLRVAFTQRASAISHRDRRAPAASLGSSAPRRGRPGIVAVLVAMVLVAMLALAASASAAYVHPTENWGFGQDGTPITEFSNESFEGPSGYLERVHVDQVSQRLSTLWRAECCSGNTLSAFEIGGPESMTPLGGNFPLPIEGGYGWGIATDESSTPSAGRIYIKPAGGEPPQVFTAEGEPILGLNFEPEPGWKTGIAVDPEGNVYTANSDTHQIEVFESAGGPPFRLIPLPKFGSQAQALAYDQLNGDLFVAMNNSNIYRFTKAANYEDPAPLHYETSGGGEMAIDAAAGILYIAGFYPEAPTNYNQGWRAYDIETGSILESAVGAGTESQATSIAADESTHTIYTTNGDRAHYQVEEWRPVAVADLTTGGSTGDATVHGTVDPAGAGAVTECKFEYVPASAFNEVEEITVSGASGGTYQLRNYANETNSEPIPYNATLAEFTEALEGAWGAGTVSVTGADGGPYRVELVGPLAGMNPGNFFAIEENLTPAWSGAVHVVTKQNGGSTEGWKTAATAPCSPAGTINAPTDVSAELTGLNDETTYHYRLTGVSGGFEVVGGEKTLTPHKVSTLRTEAAGEITRTEAELHASYEGAGAADHWWFEWGTSPYSLGESSPSEEETATGHTAISTSAEGLEPDTIYYFRSSAENEASEVSQGEIRTFRTAPAVQSLETKPATEVTPHTAELNASYVGDGTSTEYSFEWGTHRAYGQTTPAEDAGSASGPQNLAPAELTGLELETVYHYRVVATNALGTTYGPDMSFKTHPAVAGLETKAVSDLESHSATLNGAFTGNGENTTYFYKWGPSTAYGGGTSPTMESSATGVTQLTPYHLEGLVPGTTYHFQIVAENGEGVTKTADATFLSVPAVHGLKTLPATNIGQEQIQLNAEFTGNGQDTHYYFEYGPTTSYGNKTAIPPGVDVGSPNQGEVKDISATISDYLAYTTYHYRVVAENDEGETLGNDETVETLPAELPNIRNEQASNLAPTTATLAAEIDPMRWNTVYLFEYGTTPAYGEFTELNPNPIGNDHTYHPVSEGIGSLLPRTVYHFRVVAINYTGTQFGPDRIFATPGAPTVDLATVRGVTDSAAHLVGLVNPNSNGTTVHFEYGPTPAYGASTAATPIGSGRGDSAADADIAGLAPNTTYHFRVVAANAYGTAQSRDQTFTTAQARSVAQGPGKGKKCKKPRVKRHGRCVKPHHGRRHHKRHHQKHHRNSNQRNG